ncbi:MAG: YraN family protein [Clostridiales bacterium]|nr:YraN family protein [Clostridiales bacterium]
MNKMGMYGERCAARFLRDKGYKIITANYTTRLGEIDIIASDEKYIIFVEVKARGENSIAQPCEFVDENKQRKILSTAQLYLSSYPSDDLQPRFDIIEVFLDDNNKMKKINHIENAFDGE